MDDADRLAHEVLSKHRALGRYPRDQVQRLAALATSSDEAVAQAATRALFSSLVEPLADSFQGDAVTFYNQLFAQVIDICRATERGRELDRQLHAFRLTSEQLLRLRAERLRQTRRCTRNDPDVKLAVVLSRVTLGADVAITSVMIERLLTELPGAEIVLVGSRKARELFGGERRIAFHEIDYDRGGTLLERLLSWPNVLASVCERTGLLKREEFLILDPDSRLTQLGMLPVIDSADDPQGINYLFFPSREYGSETTSSIAELASDWLNEVFGGKGVTLPKLWLLPPDREAASARLRSLRCGGRSRPVVTLNFGIGGNPLKRLGAGFERGLITSLLECGARIIFDRGSGQRADAVIGSLERRGRDRPIRMIEVTEENQVGLFTTDWQDCDLIIWRGRVGLLAALIEGSDLYIGYDSLGQHIAAALGTPCIDVMTGYACLRTVERWRPTGPKAAHVIPIDTPTMNQEEVLARVMRCASQLVTLDYTPTDRSPT